MLRIRHLILSLPFVVLAPVASLGADPRPMALLKEKGLSRSGRLFVLEAEDSVLEKWKATRAVLADYSRVAARMNEAEQAARELAQLEARRVELQERLNELNQQINEQGFQQANNRPGGFGQGAYVSQLISQRNVIRMNLAEIVMTQKSIKDEAGPEKKALEAASKKSLESATAALKDVRAAVNAVTKRYDELNADASVRKALLKLEKDKVGTFKLGPSMPFKTAAKTLENAERTILAKRATAVSRKTGKSKR